MEPKENSLKHVWNQSKTRKIRQPPPSIPSIHPSDARNKLWFTPSVPSGRLYHHYGPDMCYLPWNAKGQKKPSVNLQPIWSIYHHYGPPMCYLPWRAKGQEKPSVNLQPMSSIYLGGNSKYIRKQLLLSAKYLWYTSSTKPELASAPALCTKCWWRVRRNEAIQVPARLLYRLLPIDPKVTMGGKYKQVYIYIYIYLYIIS